ncbi:MAG: cysteine--tRNA ligase [Gammaproteobacteria bacterium]|nr:cysteine--tRNA ligase [Gammaproteobacteria bacterium]
MLQIFNTLTRHKAVFVPLDPTRVRMYVCGITVYDFCHVGHARMMVVFDVVYRYLVHLFGSAQVIYVRNITDIDDKIIKRAHENQEDYHATATRFIAAMDQDLRALGVLTPSQEPRATEFMPQIIDMIAVLERKGFAYRAANGDLYYDVTRFGPYGKLAGRQLDDMQAGARVEVGPAKKNPFDFVLWKAAKAGEPAWDSPWGAGRPGWHIECSAMSVQCLGEHFDIHGGGRDLQFPHHENEIAQSCAATGAAFVNVWMHNGFVEIDKEKMSKSLGNFFTIREVLAKYPPEVLRYFILTSHYRSPLNYSDQQLDAARAALTTLYTALRDINPRVSTHLDTSFRQRFFAALDDDFATPEALAVLFDLAHAINRCRHSTPQEAAGYAHELRSLAGLLGLLHADPTRFLQAGGDNRLDDAMIQALIEQRIAARNAKNFKHADQLRDQLLAAGIVLEDGPTGTTWRRK